MSGSWRNALDTQLAKRMKHLSLIPDDKSIDFYSPYSLKFHPTSQWLPVFGISRERLYSYLDPFHPDIKEGLEWNKSEQTMLEWWKKQDKYAWFASSSLTRELVNQIQNTNSDDVEALKHLFETANKWLLKKEGTFSSRYYQVEALRNNIHDYLLKNKYVEETELYKTMYKNIQDDQYFLKQWNQLSRAASWFKTNQTEKLDEAFRQHAVGEISLNTLISKLKDWRDTKKTQITKRWDLVGDMLRKLEFMQSHLSEEVIQNNDVPVNSFER